MFIVYQEKNGIEYATLTKSIRKGATVSKEYMSAVQNLTLDYDSVLTPNTQNTNNY